MGQRRSDGLTTALITQRGFRATVPVLIVLAALTGCENRLPISSPFAATPTATAPRRAQPLADAPPPEAPATRLDVDFARTIRLEGVTVAEGSVRTGQYLRVWLHWLVLDLSQEDLRALGRVVDATGRVVGKEDDQIGPRKNYLSRWRPCDRQVDEMRIRIGQSAAPGECALVLAVLRPDNQTHVPITSIPGRGAGQNSLWGEDAVLVGAIEVTPL